MEPIESADPLSYGFRARFEFRFPWEERPLSNDCERSCNFVLLRGRNRAERIDSDQRVASSLEFHRR